MTPDTFKAIQAKLGLNNEALGKLLGVSELSVIRWRTGWTKLPGPVTFAMTALDEGYKPKRRKKNADTVNRETDRLRGTDAQAG